jgi:hypothetical protein
MLIESFAPRPDAVEVHRIEIASPCAAVYQALWTVDLGSSPVINGLMALRSLPERLFHPERQRRPRQKLTLGAIMEAGFGRLAEEPGREIVLGITGRFWRPLGNTLPFNPEHFQGPVSPGLARAVWNFTVQETNTGRTLLSTETRVVCGDAASRLKFRLYWLVIRPFSGLIRRIMLRAVRRACEGAVSYQQ